MHLYCMAQAYYLFVPIVKGYVIGHIGVYEQEIGRLASCWSKNVQKSTCTHAAFLLSLDIVNVTVNHWFMAGLKFYSCFFAHTCVPPCGHRGSDIRHVMRCGYLCVTPHHQVQPQ